MKSRLPILGANASTAHTPTEDTMQTTTQTQYLIIRSTGAEVGDVDDLIEAQNDPEFQGAYLVHSDGRVEAVGVDEVGDDEYEIIGGEGDEDELVETVAY